MQFPVSLDRRSRVPLQRQVYDAIRGAILAGRLRARDRVPATRELSKVLDVSRVTISLAYEQLSAEGYLESSRGAGTFVSAELPDALGEASSPSRRRRVDVPVRLSRYARRLKDEVIPAVPPPRAIDLSRFSPDFDGFPLAVWRRLVASQLRRPNSLFFHYYDDAFGHPPLRDAIAAYVGRSRGVECDPAQVIIVSGSQQALDLCARVLIDAGQTVAIEEPGYPGARNLFLAHGARVEATPLDAEGISTRHLSSGARLLYVTPSHQFPTGVSMSLSRRLELLAWARTRRAVIIEDDYDSEYRYRGAPLPALQSLAADVPLVYIGTFSKVMFPGLRLGYLIVPPSLARVFASAKSSIDRHTPLLEQMALSEFIVEGHLDRHVRRMRRLYAMRRHALLETLNHHFGERATILGDEAGMHVLVKFRDIIGEPDPKTAGVRMVGATKYYYSSRPKGEFVMGFTAVSDRGLREGVRRLAGWSEREF